ncbi:hypothetical protein llap_21520 [Limosa lapponica baueri]|uniref:Uncharacterized protein n=1 Tax=Limosa lapponica baueri TaxID=1758121 RepID=A0A2I0T2Z7_LIMLA|nr:hypothetical protein llap_21520 [Limosa lapponica baueri]
MFVYCLCVKRKEILAEPSSQQVLIPQKSSSDLDQLKFFLIANEQIKNHTMRVSSVTVHKRPHLEYCVQLWRPHHGLIGASPMEGHEDDKRAGAPLLSGQVETVEVVQHEEEKSLGRPYSGFPVPKGAYKKDGEGLLMKECSGRTTGRTKDKINMGMANRPGMLVNRDESFSENAKQDKQHWQLI